MRLSDTFIKPLAYTRLFLKTPNADAATLRALIEQQLTDARVEATDAGYSTADIDRALFATVAWIDETIMCSPWKGAEAWSRRPLQKVLFNTTKGGVEFFEHLDALHSDENMVREVYFLCLALGFEGRYSTEGASGRLTLNDIKARELKLLHGKDNPIGIDPILFPDAYAPPFEPAVRQRWRPSRTTLLLFCIPTGILVLLYSVFWLILRSQVNEFARLIQ